MDGHVDTYIQEQYYLLSIISLFPSVLQSYKLPKALVVPPTQPNMLLALLLYASLYASFTPISLRMLSLIFLYMVRPLFLPLLSPLPFTCSLTYFVLIYLLFHLAFFSPAPLCHIYYHILSSVFPVLPPFPPADLLIGFVLAPSPPYLRFLF